MPRIDTVERPMSRRELERRYLRWGVVTQTSLRDENRLYQGTRGISQRNRSAGFVPAYLNEASGEAVESRFADGRAAPIHVLDGLPQAWVAERDGHGHVTRTNPGVVAGFLRADRFYTREEAALALAH
jgi:hypothetical protein